MPKPHGCACVHCCALHTSTLVLPPSLSRTKNAESDRKLLGEAARVLSTGGKYMLFSAFGNDGLGHKDMADMLAHPGFGGDVQVPFFFLLFSLAVLSFSGSTRGRTRLGTRIRIIAT